MIKEPSHYKITIEAPSRRELESQLDKAVEAGITEALKCKSKGLIVTRYDYTTFAVELSQDVPFGITLERDQLQRAEGVKLPGLRGVG